MNTTLSPRKSPRQSRSAATVAAILDATARLLVERGYAATSTNAVAERAGVSVGSLYQYFPNKDALIAALHARHRTQMEAVFERAMAAGSASSNLASAIALLVETAVEAHRVEADLHQVLEHQLAGFDTGGTQGGFDALLQERLHAMLLRHRPQLAVSDLRLAAFMLVHAAHALIHAAIGARPRGVSLKAATADIVRMMVAYLIAPKAAA